MPWTGRASGRGPSALNTEPVTTAFRSVTREARSARPEGWLKVDFHAHTAEDPKDIISYSARELIDEAARQGFDALSITNHDALLFDGALERYAAARNVLLLPGVEVTASGCHIVVVNPQFIPRPRGYELRDLKILKTDASLFIAPHPFFHLFKSLQDKLFLVLPLIDAIEFTCYHNPLFNLNKKAVRTAKDTGKPLVGNSDSHNLRQFGKTYTLVQAEKTVPAIISAVKEGRCRVQTEPLSLWMLLRIIVNFATFEKIRRLIDRKRNDQ
jgi:predicted metal-dependent phosphoesterase TrpH